MLETALFAVLALFVVAGARLLRGAGPLAHWVTGWTAAGAAGFLPFVAALFPRLQPLAHPLGTLYAALLLSGALLIAGRAVPRWWLPSALVYGLVRASVARGFGDPAGYGLGLVCEPVAVFAAAYVTRAIGRGRDAELAERLLAPAFVLLGASGAVHLAVLAASLPPAQLTPLWVVVAPLVIAIQIRAAGDRLQRQIRRELMQRVAERTAELAASEERHRAISELSTDFAFKIRIDRDLRVTREWVFGGLERTIGMTPESIDGHGWLALLEPERRAELLREPSRACETAEMERCLVRPNGERCWIALRLSAVHTDAEGTLHVLGSGRDVTALKQAEAERERLVRHVERVQRLESLGIFAGGIAHDFNNLLTVIRGSARLALDDLAEGRPARARVERIATAAEHAASLTEEMLAYAGKASTSLAPLDLSALVRDSAELLQASVAGGCTLDFELCDALPAIAGDATGIRRVLMNLVLNGSEALGDTGGRVVVRTALAELASAELDHGYGAALAPGRYVVLEVGDEGHGMDPETAARVFEPFYTTKFSGRGLGMAAALGIVSSHGGAIRVESEPGRGTRVQVLFPPSAAPPAFAPLGARDAAATGGTVLLVDDDEAVLELAREVLERAGFGVIAVTSGPLAIEALRSAPEIAAAVLDRAMPGMTGDELCERLRALRPRLPVILATGYDDAPSAERREGPDRLLRKPWEPADLIAAVQAGVPSG